MYEIWLAMNIVYELALANSGLVLAYLLALGALLLLGLSTRGAGWRHALPMAIFVGAVVAIGAFLLLPGLSKSSFSELRYWLDWANLAAMAAGFGGAAALLVWPVLARARRTRPAAGR